MSKFRSHLKGGVSFTFDNNYTVSIQFRDTNYCSSKTIEGTIVSDNAEIAIWEEGQEWCTKEVWEKMFNEELGDDVVGYISSDKVADVIAFVKDIK